MSLLHEIHSLIVQEGTDLNQILLKLRYLAARLGSDPLEEWIKHESEGYPADSEVPPYRMVSVTYYGTFWGAFGSSIKNIPIPGFFIDEHVGKQWCRWKTCQSIAEIDELVKRSAHTDNGLWVDVPNMALLLRDKVYPDYACNVVRASISRTGLVGIQNVVRNRILEFTLELEKSIPSAVDIVVGKSAPLDKPSSDKAGQIYYQVFFGDVTSISSSGKGAQFFLAIGKGDDKALLECLVKAGIPESDASELAEIIASDKPGSEEEPFGSKTKKWLADNFPKVVSGAWDIGVSAFNNVLTEAAMKFYGFK